MIFAAAFGLPGLTVLAIAIFGRGMGGMFVVALPFLLIGGAALALALRSAMRYRKVKKLGTVIHATVYGYMDDEVLINDRPAQIVKLLVQTQDGPRFLLYQLGNTLKPYGIHDRIELLVYENYFLICKERNVAVW